MVERLKSRASALAGISALALLLCRCSLLLDVDGLDVNDPAADGGATGDAAFADAAPAPDAADGAAVDAPADGSFADADADADAARGDGSFADADAARGDGASGGKGDAEAGPTDAGGSDAIAGDASPTDAAKPQDASGVADASDASDACALLTHSNGVGQTWQDCTAIGTHNRTQAQSACDAVGAAANCVASTGCNLGFVGTSVAGPGSGMTTYLWVFTAPNMSTYNPGDVITYPSGAIQCSKLPRSSATWR
jgi:hypothetical protein